MIILNGNKFALTDTEFTNSLLESGSTCVGYYKPLKAQVKLFDHKRNLIGAITKHKLMFRADKLDDGKHWFSYGDIDLVGRYARYSDKEKEITNVLYTHNIL